MTISSQKSKSKYKQGIFHIKNKQKYAGDYNNVVYRSSWEYKLMKWLDENPSIIKWSSEETIIPYISPIDGKYHRYFVDFKVTVVTRGNIQKTYLLEVKPSVQANKPTIGNKRKKRILSEQMTYAVNQAKWTAAGKYATDRGWEFKIVTEKDLGIK